MGEEFNIRTDHIKSVGRLENTVMISYENGKVESWSAKSTDQITKINLLEIIFRGIFDGYNQAKTDLYEEGRLISKETKILLRIFGITKFIRRN